jgi:gas vesicle protein
MPRQSEIEELTAAIAALGMQVADNSDTNRKLAESNMYLADACRTQGDALVATIERLDVLMEGLQKKPKSEIAETLSAIKAGIEAARADVSVVRAVANGLVQPVWDIHGVVCEPRARSTAA